MDFVDSKLVKYGLAVTAAVLSVLHFKERARRKGCSLPPGPRGLPLIGNAFDLPHSKAWLTYAEWSKRYGDVVYLEALGQPIVILGSMQAAADMFEKNGVNVSDRPQSVMVDICGMSWGFFAMSYGDAWRVRRRAFHAVNLADQVIDYQSGQLADAHLFLKNLIDDPKGFVAACKGFVGANTLRSTYGIKVKSRDDPLLAASENMGALLSEATMPGSWMPEAMPWMRYIPSWMPGATFARFGEHVRALGSAFRERPWAEMEAAEARGDALPSMATRMLAQLTDHPDGLQMAKDASGMAFLAGVDTTLAALLSFVYALALHPEAQAKGQAELDVVVGRDRLPDFSDRKSLPFVRALISESLRWQSVAPVAVPHATSADMEYKGFFIPAKCIVMANSWSFLHDPAVYPEPESFKPERFLRTSSDGSLSINPDVPDPRNALFGYGRRVCPGKIIADDMIFASAVSLLATMVVSRSTDACGTPTPMHEEWTSGIMNALKTFNCTIRPRDERAANLVRETEE